MTNPVIAEFIFLSDQQGSLRWHITSNPKRPGCKEKNNLQNATDNKTIISEAKRGSELMCSLEN